MEKYEKSNLHSDVYLSQNSRLNWNKFYGIPFYITMERKKTPRNGPRITRKKVSTHPDKWFQNVANKKRLVTSSAAWTVRMTLRNENACHSDFAILYNQMSQQL